jgi:Fe2+ transport system protein B
MKMVQAQFYKVLGSFIQPLFTPLGFGVQAGEHGWTLTVASIQGIVAKEKCYRNSGNTSEYY